MGKEWKTLEESEKKEWSRSDENTLFVYEILGKKEK